MSRPRFVLGFEVGKGKGLKIAGVGIVKGLGWVLVWQVKRLVWWLLVDPIGRRVG